MNRRKEYTLQDDIRERLKDPKFKKAWEESEVEYLLARRLIEARLKQNLTQRDLAKKVNTSQAQIARIEGMNANPSLNTLKRIAKALGSKLVLQMR